MSKFQELRAKTVFRKEPVVTTMSDIIAILFHRSAATLYLIYALYAVVAIGVGIPTLTSAFGDFVQLAFSFFVLVCTAPACFGATFFPKYARLELYAGAGFVALIFFIYMIPLLVAGVMGDLPKFAQLVLVSSILVVPVARCVFVYITLIHQAEERTNGERP